MIPGKIRIQIMQAYENKYIQKTTNKEVVIFNAILFDANGFQKTAEIRVNNNYVDSIGGIAELQRLVADGGFFDCMVNIGFRKSDSGFAMPTLEIVDIKKAKGEMSKPAEKSVDTAAKTE